jgi:bifunctional non-homologous end joining protein LigD
MTPESDIKAIVGDGGTLNLGGRSMSLTSLNKVLWPAAGFTKRDMIGYYMSVANVLLPHLRDRALTLKRAPDGVEGWWWYQTQCPHPPSWVRTLPVPAASGGKTWNYCTAEDVAALTWLANLGCVEFHPLLFRDAAIGTPSAVVFDLDPGSPAHLIHCCGVALWLRELLDARGLIAYCKTSGLAGLHIMAPLNDPCSFTQTREFAASIATDMGREHANLVVARRDRAAREGKVLIDWRQNGPYKSLVAPYSLRLANVPTVSMPISWDEVEMAAARDSPWSLVFVPDDVPARLERHGDLWRDCLTMKQSLPQ